MIGIASARGWAVRARAALAALALALASGCATVNGDPRDPLEGFNRAMFTFNEGFDDVVGKPVATAYKEVVPEPVRVWVRNFFANLEDVMIGVNNLLQGKPGDAITDWARFAFNSTLGVLGINDVASEMGLEKHNEDIGQTFGRWGVGTGPYIVWPLFGPNNVRDSIGLYLDWQADPVWQFRPVSARNSLTAVRWVSRRTDLLDATRIFEEAALDKYVFQRDAYLQRRRGLVYDGKPPREEPREEPREQPGAAAPGALPARAGNNVYEPRIPRNYEGVLAAGASAR